MIKNILSEIAAESSDNKKKKILKKYKDIDLLKKVLYAAKSSKVKYYIKKIPPYSPSEESKISLENALMNLTRFSNREVSGHQAIDYLTGTLESLSADDAYVLERVIEKDLKFGMGRTNINKVIPNLIEKTPYMGAKPYSENLVRKIFSSGSYAFSQKKEDGRFCHAIIHEAGTVELVSRQGETTFVGDAPFLLEIGSLKNCVLNGEILVNGFNRYTANGIMSSIVDIEGKREERGEVETSKKIINFEKKHGSYQSAIDNIRFVVWDIIDLDEYFNKKSTTPYYERFERLESLFTDSKMVSVVETRKVSTFAEAMQHFQETLEQGFEGTIVKSFDGQWKDGKPNWQVKWKLEMTIDLKIVGFKYGKEGTKNEHVISTLVTESSCGLLKTNPSGMNEEMMEYVTENQENLLGTVVEICCNGLSQDRDGNWSTLSPSVEILRDDKDTCDSFEDAKKIEMMAKTLS